MNTPKISLLTEQIIDDIYAGRTSQSAVSRELGVSQSQISAHIRRYYPDKVVGKGGIHPSTTDTVKQAVQECLANQKTPVAQIARKYKLDYLSLARRVKKARDRVRTDVQEVLDEARVKPQPAPQTSQPTPTPDADLVQAVLSDPERLARLAEVIRALRI